MAILGDGSHFSNLGRGSPKEYFCSIILRCLIFFLFFALALLKSAIKENISFRGFFFIFHALAAILFSGAEPF